MNSILVPVDFTPVSFNAFVFASHLAERLNYKIRLIHVFSGTFDAGMDKTFDIKAGMGRSEMFLDKLKSFANYYPSEGPTDIRPVEIEYDALHGSVVKQVINLSKDQNFEMIVMGTRDKHNMLDKWLGTVSSGVSRNAHRPVLLVPYPAHYSEFRNIVFACDYHVANLRILDRIQSFNKPFNAHLQFIHIKTETNESDSFDRIKQEIVDYMMAYSDPAFSIDIELIKENEVADGLFKYSKRINADLLVLVSEHRSFLERLLHKSITKAVALESSIPMLIMHID
jgi:nucleotide-binding universal stress UspA family protein